MFILPAIYVHVPYSLKPKQDNTRINSFYNSGKYLHYVRIAIVDSELQIHA